MMSTMVYADELVGADDIPGLEELNEIEITDAEMTMAGQLIDSLTSDFEPEKYQDSYREQVLELLEAKAAGEIKTIEAPAASDDAAVIDLLAALEASVSAAKESRQTGAGAKKPAAKKKAKKKAAKPKAKTEDEVDEPKAKSA